MSPTGRDRRRCLRLFPTNPLGLSMETDVKALSGQVADISAGGACVWTDRPLAVGERLLLHLTFPGDTQPVPATARIVWKGDGDSRHWRHGLKWTHRGPHMVRLESLIARHCVDDQGRSPNPA